MAKPALNLDSLTSEEKLELIDELWLSVEFDQLPLSTDLRAELDRRLDRIESESDAGVPWEHVREQMTPKL